MGVYVGDNLVAGNVGEVYSKAQVDAMIANAVALAEPTGSIKPFAGTTIPDGYLLCDGSAISRTTYAALFAVIGTTYGTGDGSTTFNLPNLNYCIPMWRNDGDAIGQYWAGTVPNITGGIYDALSQTADGAFFKSPGTYKTNAGTSLPSAAWFSYIGFDASRSSPVYDSLNTGQVYTANRKMYMCIKY